MVKNINIIAIIVLAICLIDCGTRDKSTDQVFLYNIIKSGCPAYFDLSGKKISSYDARYYDQNQNFQFFNRTDIPYAAQDAGIKNVIVDVRCVVSPEGKVLWVKSVGGQILGKEYVEKVGYGIDEKAVSFFNVGTQLTRLPSAKETMEPGNNSVPCYQYIERRIHFGDYNMWRAVYDNAKGRKIEYMGSSVTFTEQTDSLDAFFDKNMIYPKSEIAKNISGTVQVSFYVTPEYKVLEPKIEKGINPAFDAEAMRLLNLLEKHTEPLKFHILMEEINNKLSKDKSNKQWTKNDYLKVYTTIVFNLDKIKRTV